MAVNTLNLISIEDYLAAELETPIKHEFVDGRVYPLLDFTNRHNVIAGNLLGALHARLRGGPDRTFGSQTRIRIRSGNQTRVYYPDCSVIRRQNSQDDYFQDEPVVVFEVIAPTTRRADEVEKKEAYLTIPSLSVYVLVEQQCALVVVFRRAEMDFDAEVYEGLNAVIPLPEIEAELALAHVFADVDFQTSPADDP
jgi:Uma2 family endonuclease